MDEEELEINGFKHIKYNHDFLNEDEMIIHSRDFYTMMDKRRSVREFSDEPVPKEVIENLIKTAATAPSGAHKQPWSFCAVSNPIIKGKIRAAAEKEEKESYDNRMGDRWLNDLASGRAAHHGSCGSHTARTTSTAGRACGGAIGETVQGI